MCEKYGGVAISALRSESLDKFFTAIGKKLWEVGVTQSGERALTDRTDQGVDRDVGPRTGDEVTKGREGGVTGSSGDFKPTAGFRENVSDVKNLQSIS